MGNKRERARGGSESREGRKDLYKKGGEKKRGIIHLRSRKEEAPTTLS